MGIALVVCAALLFGTCVYCACQKYHARCSVECSQADGGEAERTTVVNVRPTFHVAEGTPMAMVSHDASIHKGGEDTRPVVLSGAVPQYIIGTDPTPPYVTTTPQMHQS